MESEFFIDYAKLDDFQRQIVDKKVDKSFVLTGKAGCGKSVIALHKAKQVSALGTYAIVVYTKTLRKYFNDGLEGLGLNNVSHYNQWDKNSVDYLIIDECQDFSADQIEEMTKLGKICIFFGDTDQSIMSFKGTLQTVEETARKYNLKMFELYFNYRMTNQIAELAESVGKVEDLIEKCKRDGEKPHIISANSIDAQLDEIIRIIKNKSLSSVGILMPFNTKATANSRTGNMKLSVEYIKEYFIQKGVTNEFKYNANQDTEMDLDFHSSNPKIMTWWCAKGLQFKDVFIPCCEINYEEEKRSAIYVAMTRSSERLYICYSNTLSNFFPAPDSDLYAKNNDIEII